MKQHTRVGYSRLPQVLRYAILRLHIIHQNPLLYTDCYNIKRCAFYFCTLFRIIRIIFQKICNIIYSSVLIVIFYYLF